MTDETHQNNTRQLKMGVAGGLVKHLGLQMYSGAVPSLAELISNAWDAMATKVTLTIPFGRALEPTDEIIVSDNGHGMTWNECLNKYLIIGRNRRQLQGDLSENHGSLAKRKVMSRKGIGKLAGFGIADRVEVRTVRNGEITHFCMKFSRIESLATGLDSYEPEMLPEDGQKTDEPTGTTIHLSELKIQRAISEENFRASLARRFTILTDPNFEVLVNATPVTKQEMSFQFRFPDQINKWEEETIVGAGSVKYWFGFTATPIKDDLARGVVVHCRGKLAQQPWTFDIPSVGNQAYGLSYLTGAIQADFLDSTDGKDLIATDRGSVRWDEPPADALKQWAAEKLFKLADVILPDGKRRLDFFCKGDSGCLIVVEIKSAQFRCTNSTEIDQLKNYVDLLRSHENQNHSHLRPSRDVQGYLIAGDFAQNLNPEIGRIGKDGMFVRRWSDLLRIAKDAHKDFFELVKRRAPKDDPRLADLEELDTPLSGEK